MESHNEMKVLFEFEPWVHVLVGLHIMISLDFANTHFALCPMPHLQTRSSDFKFNLVSKFASSSNPFPCLHFVSEQRVWCPHLESRVSMCMAQAEHCMAFIIPGWVKQQTIA